MKNIVALKLKGWDGLFVIKTLSFLGGLSALASF